MESPESCLTNVLKIVGLSHIPYHVYVATNRRPNPEYEAFSNDPSRSRASILALRRGENHIREKGFLGISDLCSGELWVFDINIGFSTGQDTGRSCDTVMTDVGMEGSYKPTGRRSVEFPPHWGLRESREGIFRAISVSSTNEEATPVHVTDLTGDKPQSTEKLTILPPLEQDPPHVIYKYLIPSVLATVSYAISKSPKEGQRWIPLNITTLIQMQEKYTPISTNSTINNFSLPTPPSSARIYQNGGTDSHGRGGLMMFSLSAYLTSSGTLCIVPTGRKVDGLDNLASLLNHVDGSHKADKIFGRDVWIAPWGRVGRVQELVSSASNAPTAMRADESRWASEVQQFLIERGIHLGPDEQEWARVDVWLVDEGGEDQLHTIVWPVALCFIKLSEEDGYLLQNTHQIPETQPVSGQELSGETGNGNYQRAGASTILRPSLFEDYEYSALGGVMSPLQSTFQDPGVTWFSTGAIDPIDFAEKWKMSAEQRKQAIDQRKKERIEKRKAAEEEALKRKADELLGKEKELKREFDDLQKEAAATVGSVAGVYSTPPDGPLPANTSASGGFPETIALEPTSAVSLDAASLPLTLSTDMDLDWTGTGDPMVLNESGDVTKASATDGLAGLADFLGDDLVDGDEDIFTTEVTDKDFDFFDEPDFGETIGGGMGLGDIHHDVGALHTDTIGTTDMSSLAVANMMDMANDNSQMNLQNMDYEAIDRVCGPTGLEPHIPIPVISELCLPPSTPAISGATNPDRIDSSTEITKHVQTPPLSPQRAMKLLLPQYSKHQSLRSTRSAPPKLDTAQSNPSHLHLDLHDLANSRRQSIYSPLIFLPGVEMADKKYMEGGRFFGPPPKEEKLEALDGKLASISLLDSPLKRRPSERKPLASLATNAVRDPIHHSQQAESALDDGDIPMRGSGDNDGDSDDSDFEYEEDDESSESDVDEQSEMEYGLQPIPGNSPLCTMGNKRKRALDDDGDLAFTESGRDAGSAATPLPSGQYDLGDVNTAEMELVPSPWRSMVPDPEDYCLVDIFEKLSTDDRNRNEFSALGRMSDADYSKISQILVSQIVTGSLLQRQTHRGVDSSVFEDDDDEDSLAKRRRVSGENRVEEVVKEVFAGATRCTMEAYAAIADAPVEQAPPPGRGNFRPVAQPRRSGKHVAVAPGTPTLAFDSSISPSSTTMFKIPPSHVHVHRAETALEILPVALNFWETFGLGPCSGPKNVISFTIYPAGEAIMDAVDEFMERMGAAYDSCRLGNYVRGNIDDIVGGMIGVQLPLRHTGELDIGPIMQSIKDACIRLGTMLASIADELQNIVVYLVNPFSKASALPDICHAFHLLTQAYINAMSQLHYAYPNNVVLQIIPIDFIAVKNGLLTPSQADYIRLSLEVYNRCMVTENGPSGEEVSTSASSLVLSLREKALKLRERGTCSPSIILAKPVPKSINFQVSAEPVNPLLQEGSCLHVAYKQSLDERWVVFAWTDNYGEAQETVTYCLGKKGCIILRPWEEIAKKAWRKIMEHIKAKGMMSRVCLTKVGGWIDAEEVNLWTRLSTATFQPNPANPQPGSSNQPSKSPFNGTTTLTLLMADPSPALSLVPSLPAIIPQAFNSHASLFTPVSTPNANMLSPDPSGSTSAMNSNTGGGTPNADNTSDLDPDAQLIDYTDEVWGVLLAHRLPITPVVTEPRYSLTSGYLVKRGAKGVEGGEEPLVMGVNLVWMSSGTAGAAQQTRKNMAEAKLKEVLCQWRGLATLAQHRGVTGQKEGLGSVLPLHVAVVEKAVSGLELCM